MRRKNTERLGDVIGQVLKQNHLDAKLYEIRVIQSWAEVLGQTVNSHTDKLYFKDGTLFVRVSSSVLRHELFLERERIKNSLNKYVQSNIIKSIIFQ